MSCDKAGHCCRSMSSGFVRVTELQSKSYTIHMTILSSRQLLSHSNVNMGLMTTVQCLIVWQKWNLF